MAIFDINGNTISAGGSGDTIHVDATDVANILSTGTTDISASDVSLSQDYVNKIISNYQGFISEVDGYPTRIPLIIHTDQHGRLGYAYGAGVIKLLGKLVNWYKISNVLNLGDTCSTVFTESQLENMLNLNLQYIPFSKSINIFGNHDTWDETSGTRVYHDSQEILEPYFYNDAKRGGAGWFAKVDNRFNVKYVAFTSYQYANNSAISCINTDQADFLIRELSADDGYDIIILSHQPLKIVGSTLVDPNETLGNYTLFFSNTVTESFLSMISARKQKTSGTFVDSQGVSHNYDFSNTSSEILMAINGHTHYERYQLIENSIFDWSADWFDDATFYFAYIDKKNMKFKRWKNDRANIVDDVVEWNIDSSASS